MIPRLLRLPREGFEDFRGLRRLHSPHFAIFYGADPDSRGGSAIIVPKKVVKSAVGRHLLKRRVRHVLRPYSSRELILIVSAKSGAQKLSFKELEAELSGVLRSVVL